MVNGNAALALLPPASEPAADATDKPSEPIAVALGRAMADAVEAVGRSLADLDANGRLSDASRLRGGETIAALVEMQLAALGTTPEFGAIAIAEGRAALHGRCGAALQQLLGTDAGIDATFDMLLAHVLAVATKVSAIEMAYRSN